MADPKDRNPLILPTTAPASTRLRGCPKCGEADWDAFANDGVVTFRCLKCRNEWSGGLPGLPADPRVPLPPVNPKDEPNVSFTRTKESGAQLVPVTTRRPDLTPSFRRGAPIPGDDDA